MPSPKNPLDGQASTGQMWQQVKPTVPSCEGGQFADSPSGGIVSADTNYLDTYRDQYWNERSADPTMHANATPQHSNPTYSGRQYSDDFSGGYDPYGVAVKPPDASRGGVMVKGDDASRGKDS